MSDEAFATHVDVEARGLTLTEGQRVVADQLCEDASDIIRSRWEDVDDRIAAGTLRETSVRRVVASMVKRAMSRTAPEGVESQSETTGPFAITAKYVAAASEGLYLTGEDRRLFDGSPSDQRAFSVDMAPTAGADYGYTWPD